MLQIYCCYYYYYYYYYLQFCFLHLTIPRINHNNLNSELNINGILVLVVVEKTNSLSCDYDRFLANVNSRSRSLYAIARPSVVCLSVICRL